MILPIITYNNPLLKNKSKKINYVQNIKKYKTLINSMFETMYNASGVGLSAPQVGLNIKIFIMDSSSNKKYDYDSQKYIFINPIIINKFGENTTCIEGCLSIPGISENITRKSEIVIQYTNLNNDLITKKFTGFKSTIIQHEYDHIQGILFIQHLSNIKRLLLENKLKKIDKGHYNTAYPVIKNN